MAAPRELKRPLLRIPKGVSEPRGDRSILVRALERFAAFEGEWVNADGSRRKLSKARIEKLVDSVARRLNANSYLCELLPDFLNK